MVIAIIAILAAMLLPALARAKLKATQATCLSNLKQVALALQMYGTDNQDKIMPFPTAGAFNAMDGYIFFATMTWNQAGQTSDVSEQNWLTAVKSSGNPLFPYAPNPLVIKCPGDVRYKNKPGSGWAMDSYSKPNGVGGEPAWGASYTKLSQALNATETFAFVEDCDSGGFNVGTWVVQWSATAGLGHSQQFTWVDPIPMYHGNVNTAAFVDGHAQARKWVDGKLVNYGKSVANGGALNPPATTAGPDYDYVYNGYRFPGWAR